jgi:hypothetical protein
LLGKTSSSFASTNTKNLQLVAKNGNPQTLTILVVEIGSTTSRASADASIPFDGSQILLHLGYSRNIKIKIYLGCCSLQSTELTIRIG